MFMPEKVPNRSQEHIHTYKYAGVSICNSSQQESVSYADVYLVPQWLQYQKQRMFWDESWIINYKSIIFGKMSEAVKRRC